MTSGNPHFELGVQDATIKELRLKLTTACRQWKMYAEIDQDRDLLTEQSTEAEMYRSAIALTEGQ